MSKKPKKTQGSITLIRAETERIVGREKNREEWGGGGGGGEASQK